MKQYRQTDSDSSRWSLWHIDDNGNEFCIQIFQKKTDAETMQKIYEDRGHKQAYLVKKCKTDAQ